MDLRQLQALGAFVSRDLVKRTITFSYYPLTPADSWADPKEPEYETERRTDTADIHIRKRNSADFMEIVQASDRDKACISIHRCVCNPDGSPLFADLEQVRSLTEWMLIPLLNAVNEVNSFVPGKSRPRTSSSVTSRSPSAEGQSGSGAKRSRKKSARSG